MPRSANVGLRSSPVGVDETFVASVWGSNGNCLIPVSATAVSMNVAIVLPSAASFLTVFPSDKPRPLASSLNWVGGQAPTPNAVTVALSADGKMSFYNLSGTVHLVVDVVGFYESSSSGPVGASGPAGASGAQFGRLFAAATTVDSTGDVGRFTSITVGADANPVISYYDGTNFDLKVVKLGHTSWIPNGWGR